MKSGVQYKFFLLYYGNHRPKKWKPDEMLTRALIKNILIGQAEMTVFPDASGNIFFKPSGNAGVINFFPLGLPVILSLGAP